MDGRGRHLFLLKCAPFNFSFCPCLEKPGLGRPWDQQLNAKKKPSTPTAALLIIGTGAKWDRKPSSFCLTSELRDAAEATEGTLVTDAERKTQSLPTELIGFIVGQLDGTSSTVQKQDTGTDQMKWQHRECGCGSGDSLQRTHQQATAYTHRSSL